MNFENQTMKSLRLFLILVASTALNFFCDAQDAQRNIPDVSKIRGFNYESAPTIGHNEMWLQYSSAETVRDPSIVAALMGFFRNRGPDVMPEVPDREGRVTAAVVANNKWIANTNADWQLGLDLAERSANLLEAAQLIAMHDPPTRQVDLLRMGQPDMTALRALVQKFTDILEPYQVPVGDPQRSRPPGWIR
jgi:hypothetical protein